MKPILNDINQMADLVNENQIDIYVENLKLLLLNKEEAPNIIGLGAGRMGYALRAFVMRLCHMGFQASMIGDTNVPRVRENTIIFINAINKDVRLFVNFKLTRV